MKQKLEKLLQHPEFLVEGQLNKNKLAELARKYDAKLLELLMSDEKVKDHFFSCSRWSSCFQKGCFSSIFE